MFWEEKLDQLKKKVSKTDFRDPFTDWPEIMKKIESAFIIKTDSRTHFNHWADQLKHKKPIKTIALSALSQEINKLDAQMNFWFVLVYGEHSSAKHLVYDCKRHALQELLPHVIFDFFLIGKKYDWLIYFKVDRQSGSVQLFKSGNAVTPLD